jgi:hypothetical protein
MVTTGENLTQVKIRRADHVRLKRYGKAGDSIADAMAAALDYAELGIQAQTKADLEHISPGKDGNPQSWFRAYYSVSRQRSSDKYEGLELALKHFIDQYPEIEPEYDKEYWKRPRAEEM